MLAVRDQENLVHSHQTVAASKPLNQGVRHLQPKTPGARAPKTPFKVPLNDENDPLAFGKKTAKAAGKQKDYVSLITKDAFVTPSADPRHRAPLGMKTTNAKTKGLQTPAPPGGTLKPERTTKRGSTQRVKKFAPFVEQSEPEVQTKPVEEDVPDIEYMPPKPKDLPDIPDDITYDTTFPQFQPKNLARGLESVYGDNEIGPDGLTKRERKFQEDSAACDKMVEEMIRKQVESIGFEETYETVPPSEPPAGGATKHRMETRRMRAAAGKTKYSSSIPTIRARDAAAALSGTQRSVTRARPAVLAKPRVTSSLFPSKKPRSPTNPSSMRHSAAAATSKSTVGYSRGRDVSSKIHGKTASPVKPEMEPKRILSPETYLQPYGTPPLIADTIELGADSAEEALPIFGEDEEAENFQLTL
ncbi:hypothetical protein BO94DRAFT_538063 [Aspergillus sclerotioniger CBS 115572]|uniref:Uncharacterized protein n=1 Tax=Aspergillus sclerotioniger CBS 115572 TaxID=1450535 RepID=A0A317VW39_9EURO|nr:hypothetical protein BO94DRAFT_538063 [Aspergillus sclerotioniger CBS 115572]PWY77202.1 hypothetical protein BO94DRAFT_538063 [Aspergillus sclerotioniger CBS 115572]